MKINNLTLTSSFTAEGLSFSTMKNLKPLVAIFGRNGAGKSRLLRNIGMHISERQREYLSAKEFVLTNPQLKDGETNNYGRQSSIVSNYMNDFDGMEQPAEVIEIFPYSDSIDDKDLPDVYFRQTLNDSINNPRFGDIKKNSLNILKALCKSELALLFYERNKNNRGFYKVHNDLTIRNKNILDVVRGLIKDVLDRDFSYSTDEHLNPILLFSNHPLHRMDLSNGQQALLAYCIFIALQTGKVKNETTNLKGKIILLDEPDIYLHPKAQVDLIKGLRKAVGDHGQIWIATHSLTILSLLDRNEIWLMENGKVTSPSIATPSKVLNSLVGDETLPKLENFLASQYEWAAIQFSLECLCEPSVVTYKKNDPQGKQLIGRLYLKQPLRVLDFGAGMGRVGLEILNHVELAKNILYQPLEINKSQFEKLKEITKDLDSVSEVFKNDKRDVLNSHLELKQRKYLGYYDRILLINVLHELPVLEWEVILNVLLNSLKPNGKIILLEDQAIPRGENAHEHGFLILSPYEIKNLFSLNKVPNSFEHPDYKSRLTCIEIQKEEAAVYRDLIENALRVKKSNCIKEIKKLRIKKNKSAEDGRKNAFYTQLYCNVDMAINDLLISSDKGSMR
jgi:energy-coupling factor transporter ATP-binding protein EcfA2